MVECWVRLKSPPASAWCQCVWMPKIFFDVAGHHGIPLKKFFVLTSSRKLRHLINAITHLFSFSRNYVRFVHARYHANKHFTQSRNHFFIFTQSRNLFFIFTHCASSISLNHAIFFIFTRSSNKKGHSRNHAHLWGNHRRWYCNVKIERWKRTGFRRPPIGMHDCANDPFLLRDCVKMKENYCVIA